jgi:hypothetical protein
MQRLMKDAMDGWKEMQREEVVNKSWDKDKLDLRCSDLRSEQAIPIKRVHDYLKDYSLVLATKRVSAALLFFFLCAENALQMF